MILGRVVGELWAARRHAGLDGRKLLIIEPHCWYNPPFAVAHIVAVDSLGAGVGEDVIVCLGEPARRSLEEGQHGAGAGESAPPSGTTTTTTTPGYQGAAFYPVDAAVMAIVDSTSGVASPRLSPRPRVEP
jgi:ethanolamine utilization protein EutN